MKNKILILKHKLSRPISRAKDVAVCIWAYVSYRYWMSMPVPADEFAPTLNGQWFVPYLSAQAEDVYQKELLRRRSVAHERDALVLEKDF